MLRHAQNQMGSVKRHTWLKYAVWFLMTFTATCSVSPSGPVRVHSTTWPKVPWPRRLRTRYLHARDRRSDSGHHSGVGSMI